MLLQSGPLCFSRVHKGLLLGLPLIVLLLMCPVSVDSLSLKIVIWLMQFKNFNTLPIPDEVHQQCRDYDAWIDPLMGSSPAMDSTHPTFETMELLENQTRKRIIQKSNQTLFTLAGMLDGYEDHGLFQDWESATPSVDFIPKIIWKKPWNLEDKAGDLYQLLTTYSRILHYYVCILKDENNSISRLQRYTPMRRDRGNQESHTLPIEDEAKFDTTEARFLSMMGHVFQKLDNTTRPAVSKLTLDHNVNEAIDKMRNASNIALRILYRGNLCLELHSFLTELSDRSKWAS